MSSICRFFSKTSAPNRVSLFFANDVRRPVLCPLLLYLQPTPVAGRPGSAAILLCNDFASPVGAPVLRILVSHRSGRWIFHAFGFFRHPVFSFLNAYFVHVLSVVSPAIGRIFSSAVNDGQREKERCSFSSRRKCGLLAMKKNDPCAQLTQNRSTKSAWVTVQPAHSHPRGYQGVGTDFGTVRHEHDWLDLSRINASLSQYHVKNKGCRHVLKHFLIQKSFFWHS